MVIYLMACVVLLPNMVAIYRNAETTINTLLQFIMSLQAQADKLMEEKDRSDVLLSEMFPRSVVSQLKNSNEVEAKLFEVYNTKF